MKKLDEFGETLGFRAIPSQAKNKFLEGVETTGEVNLLNYQN